MRKDLFVIGKCESEYKLIGDYYVVWTCAIKSFPSENKCFERNALKNRQPVNVKYFELCDQISFFLFFHRTAAF